MRPPRPRDELERLARLRALKILDTPPEARFDRLTRLAAALFDVPIALISLVDEDRQWFKSRFGLEVCETPREVSFCGHAVCGSEPLVVSDARQDPRFEANPLVTGDPTIRFYAGQPLLSDGSAVGTLCLIDRRPRTLSPEQLTQLRDLAAIAETELVASDLARLSQELRSAKRRIETLEELLPLCSYCNKIRHDEQSWIEIHEHLRRVEGMLFSHGVCPDCFSVHLQPELDELGAAGAPPPPAGDAAP